MASELIYRPIHFDLNQTEDAIRYRDLLDQNQTISSIDHLQLMLAELIKTRNPGTNFSQEALQEAVRTYLGGQNPELYGVWVYYPWLNRVVHLLPEHEFVELRTSRNQYKILPKEQEKLHKKTIGVVGMSVGQSVAVTMALERCCGALRLADFDVLELSNMNRIRSGVHEIGTLKVVNTAREIFEIDPFLQVEIFPEGLHRGNLQAFFLQNGPLDLIVDECDSLDIKLLLREEARRLHIPVLMDTSDRGMLDVERFDLEPERAILHGWVGDLKADNLRDLNTEEKIPYILKIVGVDTMSERMKASMLEVEQSIRTWPQLASAVVLGGGVTCDVARRLLLGFEVHSGRYFIDLDDLIPGFNTTKKTAKEKVESPEPVFFSYRPYPVFISDFQKIIPNPAPNALDLAKETLEQIVQDAIQAPSGGNMQSWVWYWSGRQLFLFLDAARTVKLVDYNALGTLSGLGAATESLVLSAHAKGLHVRITQFPSEIVPEWVATFEFFDELQLGCESHEFDDLYTMLYKRQCNRGKCTKPIDPISFEKIGLFAAKNRNFQLNLLTEKEKISYLSNLIGATDRLRFTNEAFHTELVNEIRWSPEEASLTKDGIDLDLIDFKPSEKAGFQLARQWPLMRLLSELKGGKGIEKMTRDLLGTDQAIGLITTPEITPTAYFNGGRYYQRLWLYCTQLGIDWHPIPATLYSFLRLEHGKGVNMPKDMQSEVRTLSTAFRTFFPFPYDHGGIFLMRLVPTTSLPLKSYRRPLEDVLIVQ